MAFDCWQSQLTFRTIYGKSYICGSVTCQWGTRVSSQERWLATRPHEWRLIGAQIQPEIRHVAKIRQHGRVTSICAPRPAIQPWVVRGVHTGAHQCQWALPGENCSWQSAHQENQWRWKWSFTYQESSCGHHFKSTHQSIGQRYAGMHLFCTKSLMTLPADEPPLVRLPAHF